MTNVLQDAEETHKRKDHVKVEKEIKVMLPQDILVNMVVKFLEVRV